MYLELALAAMDELVKVAQTDEPLWVRGLEGGRGEVLNQEEYLRSFSPCIGLRPSGFVSEASRETGMVIINSLALVETLMDCGKWGEMFPCLLARTSTTDVISGGMGGTRNHCSAFLTPSNPTQNSSTNHHIPVALRSHSSRALQQTPITFQSRSPPSTQIIISPTAKLSFSGGLRLPKFTVKAPSKKLSRRGVLGAKMVDSPTESYVVALCDVAKSNGTMETTAGDLEKIEKVFTEESVIDFFANPIMSDEKKREVIVEIAKSSELQPHVVNFLNILVDMDRIELINEVVQEFELVYNKLTDTELAVVTSVVKYTSNDVFILIRN